METNLLDTMLSTYLAERTQLTIVLQNRTRISGRLRAFDSYIIVLDNQRGDILYRHAISSIAPATAPAVGSAKPAAERPHQAKQSTQPAQRSAHRKQDRPAPRTAAAAEPGLNTSMKEGLLRWMQEHKTK